jgi:hypothetical protein
VAVLTHAGHRSWAGGGSSAAMTLPGTSTSSVAIPEKKGTRPGTVRPASGDRGAANIEKENWLFLGRGFNYPVALEGALKLKEISYIHAEGLPAAEMKHGPSP